MKTTRTLLSTLFRSPRFQSMEKTATEVSSHWRLPLAATVALMLCATRASALSLATETFDSSSQFWSDRDSGEMTVQYSSGFGDPSGSLQGTFGSQPSPFYEADAFRATSLSSGGDFTGNLYLSYTNFGSISFAFYAEDVLPSTFIFRVGDGTNTFFYNINPQLTTLSTWQTVNVSLAYSPAWFGGNASAFSNVWSGVSFMDIQVGRNGTGAQDYFFDNFTLSDSVLSSVPEPGSISLILIGGIILRVARNRRREQAAIAAGHENNKT